MLALVPANLRFPNLREIQSDQKIEYKIESFWKTKQQSLDIHQPFWTIISVLLKSDFNLQK